jgi:hypothetical protein
MPDPQRHIYSVRAPVIGADLAPFRYLLSLGDLLVDLPRIKHQHWICQNHGGALIKGVVAHEPATSVNTKAASTPAIVAADLRFLVHEDDRSVRLVQAHRHLSSAFVNPIPDTHEPTDSLLAVEEVVVTNQETPLAENKTI